MPNTIAQYLHHPSISRNQQRFSSSHYTGSIVLSMHLATNLQPFRLSNKNKRIHAVILCTYVDRNFFYSIVQIFFKLFHHIKITNTPECLSSADQPNMLHIVLWNNTYKYCCLNKTDLSWRDETGDTYLDDDEKTDTSADVSRVTIHARHDVDDRLTHSDHHAKHYNINSLLFHRATIFTISNPISILYLPAPTPSRRSYILPIPSIYSWYIR